MGPIRATVNIMDSRATLRVDIGFDIGTISWPLLKSLYGIHVLLANQITWTVAHTAMCIARAPNT